VWGNHDAAWYGACLGQEALVAHVLRVSLRYRRALADRRRLRHHCAAAGTSCSNRLRDDPATCYGVKGGGLREQIVMQRMQKAAAIIQIQTRRPDDRTQS